MTDANPDPAQQDRIKKAVSFLSSPNVSAAPRSKAIAFLKSKGLTDQEIDMAFDQAGMPSTMLPSPSPSSPDIYLPPVVPNGQNDNIPLRDIVAMAAVVGTGSVGLVAALVGLVKYTLGPTLYQIGAHQQQRYAHGLQVVQQIDKLLRGPSTEPPEINQDEKQQTENNLDKENQSKDDQDNSEEAYAPLLTLSTVAGHHAIVADTLDRLAQQLALFKQRKNIYADLQTTLEDCLDTIEIRQQLSNNPHGNSTPISMPTVS